jgi:hypothetical protein
MVEESPNLSHLPIIRKTGNEVFHRSGQKTSFTLLDFWQWKDSDLIGNAERGVLAEFIVANALGVFAGVREAWNAYDLETPSGVKIEVKSAAYLQSWQQKNYSYICFNIRPTKSWNSRTNEFATEIMRQADLYIFCVLKHKDKSTLEPLNLDQWDFYVLPASALNKLSMTQKSIGLSALLKLNPSIVEYDGIAACVESLTRGIRRAI